MELKQQYTESNLLMVVSSLYNGYLTLEKALKLFDLEYGYTPEIVENEDDRWIGYDEVKEQGNMPEGVTKEHLRFVKELQELGTVNMFMARPEIEKCLLVDRKLAGDILQTYMNNYSLLYEPGSLI